jgi:phytoene dehydrogenase-like protein
MSGGHDYDAIVIGAGVNGLAAGAYLARSRRRILVVEARNRTGGMSETASFANDIHFSKIAHALYTLDPRVIKELKLSRHGLAFAVRDMPLVGLRPDGKHVTLTRDAFATARNIAVHSEPDAQNWIRFRREWHDIAHRMRALWWNAKGETADLARTDDRIATIARMGSAAWLDSWFESDTVKATLGFDAHELSPLASGSALLLVWRAAQEMCGLQGAVALPKGGMSAVADSFVSAAREAGVEIVTEAQVSDVMVDDDYKARGIVLPSGETVSSPLVLSSLSRRRTLGFPSVSGALGFSAMADLQRSKAGTAMARVTLALDVAPEISGTVVPSTARFILVERLESLAAAHAASYSGLLPQELTMEVILPAASDPALAPSGQHLVSVLVGPVPEKIGGGWRGMKPQLAARVVAALSRHVPGIANHLIAADVVSPDDVLDNYGADDAFGGPVSVERLLGGWRSRVRTPIDGLVLCGPSADPVGAVSGRAGRMAAQFALEAGSKA